MDTWYILLDDVLFGDAKIQYDEDKVHGPSSMWNSSCKLIFSEVIQPWTIEVQVEHVYTYSEVCTVMIMIMYEDDDNACRVKCVYSDVYSGKEYSGIQ